MYDSIRGNKHHRHATNVGRSQKCFEYLREQARALPASAGVYIFHGATGDLPVYVGKSVNLRSRVLSHLRNPREVDMLQQTSRISHIRTAGEIGALLLEARMIKEKLPLFNKRLRRNRQLCSLRLVDGLPAVVYAKDVDFARESGLFGLFPSRHAAQEALHDLSKRHRLCHGLIGLERLAAGRGCFRSKIGQCSGACTGQEDPVAHLARLQAALEAMAVTCWPYPGAIGLVERDRQGVQIHVVRNWCYLGTVETPERAVDLVELAAGFDADGYRILCAPILRGQVEVMQL